MLGRFFGMSKIPAAKPTQEASFHSPRATIVSKIVTFSTIQPKAIMSPKASSPSYILHKDPLFDMRDPAIALEERAAIPSVMLSSHQQNEFYVALQCFKEMQGALSLETMEGGAECNLPSDSGTSE
jgi:hypothetical protein